MKVSDFLVKCKCWHCLKKLFHYFKFDYFLFYSAQICHQTASSSSILFSLRSSRQIQSFFVFIFQNILHFLLGISTELFSSKPTTSSSFCKHILSFFLFHFYFFIFHTVVLCAGSVFIWLQTPCKLFIHFSLSLSHSLSHSLLIPLRLDSKSTFYTFDSVLSLQAAIHFQAGGTTTINVLLTATKLIWDWRSKKPLSKHKPTLTNTVQTKI